mmetsp:Transcript_16113/g.21089  ORF Transcript_16113/g.21089 Transcript_16113/m.21089 type:complete len:99 (+) Transcript_16113:2473-2769(+)
MLSMLVLSYMPIFFKLGSTIAQSEAHKANLQVELLMLPAPSSISIAPSASGGVRVNDSAGAGVPDGVNDTVGAKFDLVHLVLLPLQQQVKQPPKLTKV